MPQAIELLIKNWKTTSPGITMIAGALYSMFMRYQAGQSWFPNEVEFTAISGGIGLIYAKAHNVTGGDKSNGLVPEPIQQAKARIEVAAAKIDPDVAAVAPVDLVEIAKIQQEMLALQARLDKAKGA